MTSPEDLPLRDIHLPAEPSWWPPAPGWWLLLGILIAVLLLGYYLNKKRSYRRLSAVNLARQSLSSLKNQYAEQQDGKAIVRELSILLRRLSISIFPRADSAGLTGDQWLLFLDQSMSDKIFSQGPGRILIEAPYRPDVQVQEVGNLFDICEQWIEAASRRGANS